jgi:hypothetical protein
MATIKGFERDVTADGRLDSIGQIFEGFMDWFDDPSTLVVRFENLIGARGGGDSEKQLAEIRRIGDFVGRPLNPDQTRQIAQNMYGKGSLTYRKGQAGNWRDYFTEAHRRAFNEVTGDILVKLGYESNTTW